MTELECYACGSTFPLAERKRCPCGEPLWFPEAATFEPSGSGSGMWRYADLLPVDPPSGVGAAAGGTPLVRTEPLDEFAGTRIHVKDEGENPTGSFKDRGSAVGVAYAAGSGKRCVGTVSHGNMAMSMAAHAAAADVECVVLVPDDISEDRLANVVQYGPETIRVEGDYGRLYDDALSAGATLGIEFVNSDTPLRVAGQKTVALEICEGFAPDSPDSPDSIVLPVSSGGLLSATWKALRELDAAGLADLPRLYAVQSAACAPIAEAFERGDDRVSPVEGGETVAYSIANADPPSGNRALAALRATDGGALAVADDEILAAKGRLARDAGLCVEASSAVALAGARRLAARGDLGSDEDVVVVATGNGFKERDAAGVELPEIVPLDGMRERLSGFAR